MLKYDYLANKPKGLNDQIGTYKAQIYLLNRRLYQTALHLKIHKKDYSCIRGVKKILKRRKQLFLKFLKQDYLLACQLLIMSRQADKAFYKD